MQMRRTWVLVLSFAALSGAYGESEIRLAVPDAATRAAALAKLRKERAEELKAKDADARRSLARELLGAAELTEDPAERYVLREQAAVLAQEAHDVRLALEAVDALASIFDVPRAARKHAAVEAATKGAKEAGPLGDAATACVDIAGEALAADDPTTAGAALAAAKKHATAAKLGGLAARASELLPCVGAFRTMATQAEAARAVLATTPDDPAANEAVAHYLCFGRNDWAAGLPHLAKAADAGLREVAAQEAQRDDASAKPGLADAWWALAQKEKDVLVKARMLARAAALYEEERDTAAEPRRAEVASRLASLTWFAWDRGVAVTKDFSKAGPDQPTLGAIREYIASRKIDRTADDWRTKLPKFPAVTFGSGVEYLWNLETTHGPIVIRFLPDTAPQHVANFLYLTELGFFDGLIFHRVIPGFMAQGGCPRRNGSGDPGYTFEGEFAGTRKHDRAGVLSMANTGQPKSDGSQFFITFAAASHLDGKHTIFGEVVSGNDVLKKLEEQGTEAGTPKSELVLKTARVTVR